MSPDKATAAQAAKALRKAATEHKRMSAAHRRSAQKCMRELDELRRRCRELGIELLSEGEDP